MSVKRPSPQQSGGGSSDSETRTTSLRVRNPQGQGGRLRAELIAAADRLLAQTGDIEGLALRAVAREVGIATPSIYLHFPDKAALVRAVLGARFEELGEAVKAAVLGATGPAEQLRAGCLAYCRFATDHPNAYRVLFGRRPPTHDTPLTSLTPTLSQGEREQIAVGSPSPAHRERGAGGEGNPGAAAFGFLVDGVERCMRARIAPDADPFRVARNVWTALHGMVSLRSTAPEFPWPPLEQQVDDVLSGMVGLHHNPPSAEG
jgi:AcrR family transcriptional regulator